MPSPKTRAKSRKGDVRKWVNSRLALAADILAFKYGFNPVIS